MTEECIYSWREEIAYVLMMDFKSNTSSSAALLSSFFRRGSARGSRNYPGRAMGPSSVLPGKGQAAARTPLPRARDATPEGQGPRLGGRGVRSRVDGVAP